MEEDIKVLEEFIKNYKEVQEKYKDDEIQAEIERSCYFEEVPAQAIENLIKGYKELEEEHQKRIMLALNKELIIVNSKMYTIDKELYNDLLNDTVNNYIPKAKLIEIADKYKKILNKLNKSEDIDRIKAINERLILIQELLLQEGDK